MNKEIPGLTVNESLVYITLLSLKEAGATKISEKCGLFRTLVYDILTKLIEKGLVSYIKKESKRLYKASSPNRLLELIKEKEDETKKIVENLNQTFQKPTEEILVEQYDGVNGMKVIIEDIIESAVSGKAKEALFLGPTGDSWEFFAPYFIHAVKKVKASRLLRKGDFRVIWSSELKTKRLKKLIGGKKDHRFLPKGFNPTVPVIIYGNKVVVNGKATKPFVVLIQNRNTAESFKHYFNFIWEHSKKEK